MNQTTAKLVTNSTKPYLWAENQTSRERHFPHAGTQFEKCGCGRRWGNAMVTAEVEEQPTSSGSLSEGDGLATNSMPQLAVAWEWPLLSVVKNNSICCFCIARPLASIAPTKR